MKTLPSILLTCLYFCPLLVTAQAIQPNAPSNRQTAAPAPAAPSAQAQHPYLMAQLGHSGAVNSVAFSPDGRYVLTGSVDKTARLWETTTGKEIRRFAGHTGLVHSVAFSPDGRYVLTGSEDNTARLWETATGKPIRSFQGHKAGVTSVAFSPNGRYVLTGSWDDTVRLWETGTGKEIRRFVGHTGPVYSVAFSPDGRYVLTGSVDKTARLWETTTGKEIRTFQGHTGLVESLAFSPDGRYVLTGSGNVRKGKDDTARLWETTTGKEIRTFQGLTDEVHSVAFSPDGRYVLTGSWDDTVRLWETATGKEIRSFQGHSNPVTSVAFSPDGRYVLTGSDDETARLWETTTGKEIRSFQGHTNWATPVAFSPDGRYVLTGSGGNISGDTKDNTARLWETATGKEIRSFQGHAAWVNSVAFSPDGRYVLTGSIDGTARLWETTTGKEIRTFQGQIGWVNSVAFSPDGRFVLTASGNGFGDYTTLWETTTGKEIRRFLGHKSPVWSVAFSPDGRYVLTGSIDGTARLWETTTGKEIREFEGHTNTILSVAFSPNGRYVLTGSEDYSARLWETATGKEIRRFAGHDSYVNSVAFSRDGRYVLTGSGSIFGKDNTARLWEAATGKEIRRFQGHTDDVTTVAFSQDGRYVLTGSRDNTDRLWETSTGKELCSLISFRDGTWAVTDPWGRYDASNAGEVEGLHWVVGNHSIDLAQLKERYFEPGLLAKILAHKPLREVQAFTDVPLFPEVTGQALEGNTLTVTLANQGGGLGKVQVYVNNTLYLEDARPQDKREANASTLTFSVDISSAPTLRLGQQNEVRVVPFNAAGWLPARGTAVVSRAAGNTAPVTRRLFGIIVGIDEYAAPELHLLFAAEDAARFAQALQRGARNFFGTSQVSLHLLTTTKAADFPDLPAPLLPTKSHLRQAFEAVRHDAGPEDVVVVYLAGHGVALSTDNSLYCYLTQEANSADTAKLNADASLRAQTTVSSLELADWMTGKQGIKANYRVMVLDTCAAGAAESQLTKREPPPGDQIRAMERFKDRTGFHLLMGCAADRVSYEASQYGEGVLTYALLQGMKGPGLRVGEWVDVSTLFSYAEEEVPKLAGAIEGVQQPRYPKPGAGSFDIGKMEEADRAAIPLASARPQLLKPVLLNAVKLRDDLGLTPLLTRQLREASYSQPRGGGLVYVEAEALPGAIVPSGTYSVQGNMITVRLVLSRDDKELAQLDIEGSKDALPDLVAKLTTAIYEAAGRQP